jgi:hypothetical protein
MALEMTIVSRVGKGRKGRSFRGIVFAYAIAPGLWGASGTTDALRPIYLSVAASDDEASSVLENLRAGERAQITGEHLGVKGTPLELMRSANYAFPAQRTPEGTIFTAYLPELFDFHAGLLDQDAVRFVLAPALEDFEQVPVAPEELTAVWRHLSALGDPAESAVSRELCAMAAMWAAYLDQRCELPIPPDLDFRAQLYVAALREGLASKALPLRDSTPRDPDQRSAFGFRFYRVEGFPLMPGIASRATHPDLADFLAEQLQRYERARPKASRRRRLAAALRGEEAA